MSTLCRLMAPLVVGALVAGALGLGGCAALDPELRGGEWRPSGANQANLAAMVASPADLTHGVAHAGADGQEAAVAVARLRAGTVKPLPDSGLAEVRLQSNGGAAGAAAIGGGS